MIKTLYSLILIFATGLIVSGCENSAKKFEDSEETTAEVEAAMIEGRNAAKGFVNKNYTDTMQLHLQLLEARAQKSKYEIEKKTRCAAAYDSAFVGTLRTVRPDVASALNTDSK